MTEDRDDTFLARWLNNELSEEELKAFEASPEYAVYQKILAGTASLESPSFDAESSLSKLKLAKGRLDRPVRSIGRTLWPYGIAAAIAFLVGFFLLRNPSTTINAGYGQQLALALPDQSEVILNAGSNISFKEKSWENERLVTLEGEALFRVEKGSTFTVQTERGDITVLGTVFNVKTIGELLEVSCYEGKVQVSSGNESEILTQGRAVRILSNQPLLTWEFTEQTPGWTRNQTTFKSIPTKFVLEALEKQYDIRFDKGNFDDEILFTGSFPNDDLEVALKSVFGPLQVDYTIEPDQTVVLK